MIRCYKSFASDSTQKHPSFLNILMWLKGLLFRLYPSGATPHVFVDCLVRGLPLFLKIWSHVSSFLRFRIFCLDTNSDWVRGARMPHTQPQSIWWNQLQDTGWRTTRFPANWFNKCLILADETVCKCILYIIQKKVYKSIRMFNCFKNPESREFWGCCVNPSNNSTHGFWTSKMS